MILNKLYYKSILLRSEKNIHSLPKSLFMDPRHVARQFTYITGAPPLNQEIEKNLKTFIGWT